MSYSGNPNASIKDWIRFKTGDKNPSLEILSDEEINFIIVECGVEPTTEVQSLSEDQQSCLLLKTIDSMLPQVLWQGKQKVGDVDIDFSGWYDRLLSYRKDLATEKEAKTSFMGFSGSSDSYLFDVNPKLYVGDGNDCF